MDAFCVSSLFHLLYHHQYIQGAPLKRKIIKIFTARIFSLPPFIFPHVIIPHFLKLFNVEETRGIIHSRIYPARDVVQSVWLIYQVQFYH